MFTEDYFKRLVSQVTVALMQALGFRKAGQSEQAYQTIEQALAQLFAMRKDLSDRLDDDSLLDILSPGGELDLELLSAVANLYQVNGEILAERNQPAQSLLEKSRALRFYLEAAFLMFDELTPELCGKIEVLRRDLKSAQLPEETRQAMQDYYTALLDKTDPELRDLGLARKQVHQSAST